LPFNVLALVYHYVYFALPALFNFDFYDLSGPVIFTEQACVSGGRAVALSTLALYAGMRLGERLGRRGRGVMVSLSPPAEIPNGYRKAILIYGAACFVTALSYLLAPSLIPQAISLIVVVTLSFDFAIGLVLSAPQAFRDRFTRKLDFVFVLLGGSVGILRGILEPIIRLSVATAFGKWATLKRLPYALLATIAVTYLILQPIKGEYRSEIWIHSRSQATVAERIEAWGNAFTNFWSDDSNATQEEASTRSMSRIAELDSVMHAFDMLPGRVKFLDGAGWMYIPVSFIPRFIWRDKPTTQELAQRYAVEFYRQTEVGARTTAIMLPLIIDGYWNLGWPGIAIASILVGLWVGAAQRLFAGEHWALFAMGIAHLARLSSQASVTMVFSGLFQNIAGLLVISWAIHWLAKFISAREAQKVRRFVGLVPPRARVAATKLPRRVSPG